MGAFISKQPNGKYCRFSTVVDTVTDYDMTEEDYIEMCVEKAKKEAKDVLANYTRPFQMVIDYFYPNNDTKEQFAEKLKEMGASEEQINEVLTMEVDEDDE